MNTSVSTSLGQAVVMSSPLSGWVDVLRLPTDPDATSHADTELALTRLLDRGLPATGGVALGLEFTADATARVVTAGAPQPLVAQLSALGRCGGAAGEVHSLALPAAAAESGLRAHLVLPLSGGQGCLSFFDVATHVEPAAPLIATLRTLADWAGVHIDNAATLMTSYATIAQLREAMVSRSVIEQAKGVLMARERVDAEMAWAYLVRISQRSHRKLREICVDIVEKAIAGSLG